MLSSVSTLLTSVLRYEKGTSACCSVMQRVAACCSVLQHVVVCCSVLQCVAARCSVLQVKQRLYVAYLGAEVQGGEDP